MAHEFEKGFSVREPAWHGLAQVLDDYPGREEAIKIAGHDWKVIARPSLYADCTMEDVVDGKLPAGTKTVFSPEFKHLVRSDTGRILSVMHGSYEIVQNETLWDIIDLLVKEPNVKYETAGVLQGGRTVWVMARLDEPVRIPGDNTEILPYVCVSAGHDAFHGLTAMPTSVRVICMNTFKMADMNAARKGTRFTFRHTKNVLARIEDARAAMGMVRKDFAAFIELSNELGKLPVTEDGVKEFLSRFIPDPPADIISSRVRNNIDEARGKVKDILISQTIPEAHRRTAYGLFQAGTEYLDHIRVSRTPETYFKRCVLDAETLKGKLVKLVREVAAA